MPRAKVRRIDCDCRQCALPKDPHALYSALHVALARQDPPPKSFILAIDSAVVSTSEDDEATSLDEQDCPHIDSIAREGCTGLLAICPEANRGTLLEQLLGPPSKDSLPARFKNVKIHLMTNNRDVANRGETLQCEEVDRIPLDGEEWPDVEELAQRVVTILNIQPIEGYVGRGRAGSPLLSLTPVTTCTAPSSEDSEISEYDVSMILISTSNSASGNAYRRACTAVAWAESLLRYLDTIPGFQDTVLTTLVFGSSVHPLPKAFHLATQQSSNEMNTFNRDCLMLQRPVQSFQLSGVDKVDVLLDRPAVVVHRLNGVIRKDMVDGLVLAKVEGRGGGGCILVERMFTEIAYKLGFAPKYGA